MLLRSTSQAIEDITMQTKKKLLSKFHRYN